MGKRYHCEYCNRSFADTLHTRKNHINGVHHKRNRLGGKTPDKSQAGQPQATLKEWLEKYNKKKKKVECKDASGKSASQSSYTLPPGLPPLRQLPPSLLPPPPGGYSELPREEWG